MPFPEPIYCYDERHGTRCTYRACVACHEEGCEPWPSVYGPDGAPLDGPRTTAAEFSSGLATLFDHDAAKLFPGSMTHATMTTLHRAALAYEAERYAEALTGARAMRERAAESVAADLAWHDTHDALREGWIAWLPTYGAGPFYDAFMRTAQGARSECVNCGQAIYLDISEGGGVADWQTSDGDYGCGDSPETTDDGVGGHEPVKGRGAA